MNATDPAFIEASELTLENSNTKLEGKLDTPSPNTDRH
jgi:hypothetical protein